MSVVLKIESLWKEYRLGVFGQRMLFRDVQSWWARARGKEDPNLPVEAVAQGNGKKDRIWALRDVSLDVRQGEVLGIIGRNGAGKSTLLKIITKVTAPTRGTVKIRGRVASLLEVGTGFHPELTGRENVFLNGTILGMTVKEIKRKFDEIVDFSGVEQYIDTPVKRYSSGMHVRLAFAVAAHLESEILLVDEVLAVGDAEFQKKCVGKMAAVSNLGRTILFVSHNMNAVERLCSSGIVLQNGEIVLREGYAKELVRQYLMAETQEGSATAWYNRDDSKFRNQWFQPTAFYLSDTEGAPISGAVANDRAVWVHIEGIVQEIHPALTIGYAIYTEDGNALYWSYHTDEAPALWPKLEKGVCKIRSQIPKRFLNEGTYRLELIGGIHFAAWLFQPGTQVPTVFLSIRGGLSDSPHWIQARPGLLGPVMRWSRQP